MYDYGNTDYSGAEGLLGGLFAVGGLLIVISIVIGLIPIISQWIIYKKAGKPGWANLVPIYNIIVLLEIVELPIWYIALFFVPFANIYAMFKIYIELAHKFGKTTGFGVATAFFPIICLPILAFGKNNVYQEGNSTVTPVNNNESMNQYNPNVAFPNELNNVENNNLNEATPMMFNQNINTEINPIPTNSAPTNEQVMTPMFTNSQTEIVSNPVNEVPQNNVFETPNVNPQPAVSETMAMPSMQPVENNNNVIQPTSEPLSAPTNTFVYNSNIAPAPEATPVVPVQEPQVATEMPILQSINNVQPQANVVPAEQVQNVDNNQNNTTM